MKNRIGLVVLVLVCLGLGIALVTIRKQASDQQQKDSVRIDTLSNDLTKTSTELKDQQQVNAMFEKDLDTTKKALTSLTNEFTTLSSNYSETTQTLAKTETALRDSQAEVAKRDAKITDLETQNQALDRHALDLSSSITNLTIQIADTERKLAASEGDKALLEKELKRLMAEKAELERQFNDLTVMRAQVAKLKEELNIARRVEWIRQGLFASAEQKGAQKLMQGFPIPQSQPKAMKANYDLNVEVGADGSVKVIPPVRSAASNAPPNK